MQRRTALFQFVTLIALVMLCLFGLTSCWNIKELTGKDSLGIGNLIWDDEEIVSEIALAPDRFDQSDKPASGLLSLTVYVNTWLQKNLIVGKTTLAEVIKLLGEPQEVKIEADKIILVYFYREGYERGHYQLTTRKLETKGNLSYFVTVVLAVPGTITRGLANPASGPLTIIPISEIIIDNRNRSDLIANKLIRDHNIFPDVLGKGPPVDYLEFRVTGFKSEIDLKGDREDKFDPLGLGGRVLGDSSELAKRAAGSVF